MVEIYGGIMSPVFLNSDIAPGIAAGFCGIFWIFYIMVWLTAVALGIALFILKILMIIDCARKRFDNPNEQVVWILVIMLVPFGSVIYYFAVKYKDPESPGLGPRPMRVVG